MARGGGRGRGCVGGVGEGAPEAGCCCPEVHFAFLALFLSVLSCLVFFSFWGEVVFNVETGLCMALELILGWTLVVFGLYVMLRGLDREVSGVRKLMVGWEP